MDPLTIAALAGTALQAITGGIKGAIGSFRQAKAMRAINQGISNLPKYTRPESYDALLNMVRQNARTPNKLESMLSNRIGTQQAASIRQINKAAPSSTAALGAITDVYGRTLNAVRDLGLTSLQWQDAWKKQLAGVYGQGIGLENMAYQLNERDPAMMRLNLEAEKFKMGREQASQGFNMFASGMSNLGSTAYGINAYNKMYPNYNERPTIDYQAPPMPFTPLPTDVNPFKLAGNYGS